MSSNTLMTVQFSRNAQLLGSIIHSFIKQTFMNFDYEPDTVLGTKDMKRVMQDPSI